MECLWNRPDLLGGVPPRPTGAAWCARFCLSTCKAARTLRGGGGLFALRLEGPGARGWLLGWLFEGGLGGSLFSTLFSWMRGICLLKWNAAAKAYSARLSENAPRPFVSTTGESSRLKKKLLSHQKAAHVQKRRKNKGDMKERSLATLYLQEENKTNHVLKGPVADEVC